MCVMLNMSNMDRCCCLAFFPRFATVEKHRLIVAWLISLDIQTGCRHINMAMLISPRAILLVITALSLSSSTIMYRSTKIRLVVIILGRFNLKLQTIFPLPFRPAGCYRRWWKYPWTDFC